MALWRVTRRAFLRAAVLCGVLGTSDWVPTAAGTSHRGITRGGAVAFRRSGRGRHVSNAAKSHNANLLYATELAAANNPAHPGDKSRVVPVVIGAGLFDGLFGSGRVVADLRHDLRTLSDYASLKRCLRGPAVPVEPGCDDADLNKDRRVDLRDFAVFQDIFTGS